MSPRVRIIVLIMVAQTVTNVGPLGVPAIASLIRADLGLTLAQAGSFLSMYYIGPSLISLPAGTLVDRWGVKRMLVLGQVLTAVGLLFASTAHSYIAFILLLVAAGFGYGVLNPTSTKAVMAWSPPAHRATLVGFKQVGLPLGGMLGAALLPALALALGWRTALVASAAVIAAGAIASVLVYHDPPDLALPAAAPGARGTVISVLTSRDLWLLSLAAGVFAAMQTVWMSYLVLYLQGVVGPHAARGQPVSGPGPVRRHDWAASSSACSPIACSADGAGCRWSWPGSARPCARCSSCRPAPAPPRSASPRSRSSSAWSGSAGTACSTRGWPSWPGPGRPGRRSAWAWRSPRRASRWARCSSGTSCRSTGGYRWPWLGLAAAMVGALGTLTLVRERRRPV